MNNNFLDKNNIIAIVGVSQNESKWGRKVYEKLKKVRYKVYPINPKYKKIGEEKCYPNLKSINKKIHVVITVVPPQITLKILKECLNLGIKMIWMQPGSESKKSIEFCEQNDIECIHNSCIVVNGLKTNF